MVVTAKLFLTLREKSRVSEWLVTHFYLVAGPKSETYWKHSVEALYGT